MNHFSIYKVSPLFFFIFLPFLFLFFYLLIYFITFCPLFFEFLLIVSVQDSLTFSNSHTISNTCLLASHNTWMFFVFSCPGHLLSGGICLNGLLSQTHCKENASGPWLIHLTKFMILFLVSISGQISVSSDSNSNG